MKEPVKVAIVGAGIRGQYAYAPFSKLRPDLMQITAVAEVNEDRRSRFVNEFNISPEKSFCSAEEFLQHDKMADLVIIATQDKQHYGHVIPAMKLGYDILLEKPVSTTVEECVSIAQAAHTYKRKVAVCHVLRYTIFYQLLKFYIDSGRIGDVVSISHTENVGWWHQAHSFVRGNWRNSKESCPMILAKSCHDMDILRWLIGKECLRVSSFGSTSHFKSECAPEGAAERCLGGCKAKAGCQFDAEKIYAYQIYGSLKSEGYSLAGTITDNKTTEGLYKALREGPYGRCVYHCDNDVVDHQIVNLEFEGGITANFNMCGFTSKFSRDTRIFGTRGEISADMDSNKLNITTFGQPTETVDVTDYTNDFSGHGGGDNRMLKEYLGYLRGDCPMSSTLSTIDTSIESHIIALAAERSRLQNGTSIEVKKFMRV